MPIFKISRIGKKEIPGTGGHHLDSGIDPGDVGSMGDWGCDPADQLSCIISPGTFYF